MPDPDPDHVSDPDPDHVSDPDSGTERDNRADPGTIDSQSVEINLCSPDIHRADRSHPGSKNDDNITHRADKDPGDVSVKTHKVERAAKDLKDKTRYACTDIRYQSATKVLMDGAKASATAKPKIPQPKDNGHQGRLPVPAKDSQHTSCPDTSTICKLWTAKGLKWKTVMSDDPPPSRTSFDVASLSKTQFLPGDP